MGYSIGIGEKEIEKYEDDEVYIYAKTQNLEEAPQWEGDELTGNSNQRYPSYSGFSSFCSEANIYGLFYGEEGKKGILHEHPGYVDLKQEHLDQIRKAKNDWIKENPNTEAGFLDGQDYILARLIWFEFWMDWALKHCKTPIIYNS